LTDLPTTREEDRTVPETPDLVKLQEQVFDLVRRSQEAVLDAGRSFADNLTSMAPSDSEAVDKLLDDAFEFTEKVLRTQRDFAKSVVQAITAPIADSESSGTPGAGDRDGSAGEQDG
jgi:hypothetical protein